MLPLRVHHNHHHQYHRAGGCLQWLGAVVLVLGLGGTTSTVGAEEQPQVMVPVVTTTDASSAPANAAQAAADATANTGTAFNLSLPVDYERCHMIKELNAYVDSIEPQDIAHLQEVQQFLLGCQELLEQRIDDNQRKLSELKSQEQAAKSQ